MGYWNETCMLTSLPIGMDEPVAALLIVQKRVSRERTEPDDLYAPITPVIHGKYDSYGSLKDVKRDTRLSKMLRDAGCMPLFEQTPDTYESIKNATIGNVLKLAERQELYLEMGTGLPAMRAYGMVYLVMMKERFFEHAIDSVSQEYLPREIDAIARSARFCHGMSAPLEDAMRKDMLSNKQLRELAALRLFMRRHRKAFVPTTGAGSQTEVETKRDLEFYEAILDEAQEIYRKFNN